MELLGEMGRAKVERSTFTCSAAISACGRDEEWQRAMELLCAMGEAKVEQGTITYKAAISA